MFDADDFDNRNVRRVPINCAIRVKVPETLEVFYGTAHRLSVDDVHFEVTYVPRYGQMLEICIAPPPGGGGFAQPLRAMVQVYRCVRETDGERYNVGGAIRKILQ